MKENKDKLIIRMQGEHETIHVEESDDVRVLHFHTSATQTMMLLRQRDYLFDATLQHMMGFLLCITTRPKKYCIAGLGGGSMVRALKKSFPRASVVSLDYDSVVIDVANTYFGLPPASERYSYITESADKFFRDTKEKFDVVMVDLHTSTGLPDFLSEEEFYIDCRRCLTSLGVLVVNLSAESELELVPIIKVLRKVFNRRCLYSNVPGHNNTIVYAFSSRAESITFQAIERRAESLRRLFGFEFLPIWEGILALNPSLRESGRKSNLSDLIP